MEYQVQSPAGEMHVIDGPEGASDQDIAQAAQQLFGQGKLEAFGRAAVNNLPAGGQLGALGTAALKGTNYSQGMEEFNKKIQEAKAEHPIAYGAGAVTGSLAPLAIPGVGEAMAAAPTLTGAGLGALNAVGNTDIAKEPTEALKQAGEGAVLGGAIGRLMPSGTKTAEELESYANKKGVQALNLRPGTLGIPDEELEDLGRFAHESDLIKGATQERAQKASDLLQQVGAQIGDIGAGAMPLKDATPFVENIHNSLQDSASIYGAEANPEATIYRQGIANLQQPGITFDKLQQLKTAYGQRAFDANGDVKNDAAANVYRQIKDAMKSIITDSPAEYQDTMETYGKLKDIHSGIMSQLQKEQAQGIQAKGFGMAGKMAGMVGGGNPAVNVGLGVALAPAHPFMAIGAMTPLITNPQAMSGAARGLAETLPKAAQAVTAGGVDAVVSKFIANPSQYGKFSKPLMNALQTGGKQGFAATSFVLRQQHPELNDMMLESGKHLIHHGTENVLHNAINEGD